MSIKIKNDEKAKGQPQSRWIPLLIVAGVLVLIASVGWFFLKRTQISNADFAYSTNCGINLFDLDTQTITYSFPDECTMIHDFDFSPDGTRVAYTNNEGKLMIAQVRPFEIQATNFTLADVSSLAWSPDGNTIAVWEASNLQTGQMLVLIDVATGDITEHGIYSVRYTSLSWSPNSRELLFATDHSTDMELVHYNIDTREVTALTDDDNLNRYAIWSGHNAIFSRRDVTTARDGLWMLDLTTGDMTQLASAYTIEAGDVSPDGRYLTYMATDDNAVPGLFWMDLETLAQEQIMSYEPQAYMTQWLPTADFEN